jgi:xylulokinase
MMPDDDLILGYDVGTSSVKVGLFDPSGRAVASGRQGYPLLTPAPGWAEQRPDDWWQAMCGATRRLLADSGIAPGRIVALGMSAQVAGAVPVDRAGEPLHNALIWLDTRSEPIARRLTGGPVRIGGYGLGALARWLWRTNGAPNREGRDPTSKYLWFREAKPEIWSRVHKLLDVKDYLLHRATGRFVTTPDCAHLSWLMDSRRHRKGWSEALLAHVGLEAALLPEIVASTAPVGTLRAEAAAELGLAPETLVAAGAGDITAFALGAGRLETGALLLHIGTSAWWGCHLPRRKVDPLTGIATLAAAEPERYLLVAAQEAAGACVEWAGRGLGFETGEGIDFAAFDGAAAAVSPDPAQPFFFPWLGGERVPVDDRHLRGGFAGLSARHGRAELAHAVLEGVALNIRWAMRTVDRMRDSAEPTVRFLGGGAASAVWAGLLADVLQRPLETVRAPELGGAAGAAMTAAVAAGWYPDLEAATGMARVERRHEPDAELGAHYQARFDRFLAHFRRTRKWHRRAT